MPFQSSDGALLRAVAEALTPVREVSGEGAEEALALYVDLGDSATQRSLDACLEQVADLLRALEGDAGEQVTRLLLASRRLGARDEVPADGEPDGEPDADAEPDADIESDAHTEPDADADAARRDARAVRSEP